MKKILLLFSFLLVVFSFSQNKQLYEKEWKLTSLYLNDVNETIPSAPKNIYIKFNNVFSSFGFNSKVCSEILGPINYSTTAPEFTITGVNTSGFCDDTSLQNFQPKFLLFLSKNLLGTNKFTYTINVTSTGYELILYNFTNDIAKFEYNFPKGDITNKTWRIKSLLINSVLYPKPNNFECGITNFSTSINTGYFNGSQITPYYTGNSIYNIAMSTTLGEHYDIAVNYFDNLYHSTFWRNAENNSFTYEINGNELVITSATGNKAYYDFVENQGQNLKDNKWNINSLKIGNQTFTPTITNSQLTFLENTINATYFNLIKGNITYNSGSFNIYNSDVTIVDSFNPTIAEFDEKYLENFWGTRANAYYIIPNNPFNYYISSDGNTLTITNSKGDIATYNKEILSTQDIQKNKLKIYNNPTSDFITIENLKTNSLIKVFDISGKIFINKKILGNSFDVKSLPKGIYFLEIDGYKPLKFIKK